MLSLKIKSTLVAAVFLCSFSTWAVDPCQMISNIASASQNLRTETFRLREISEIRKTKAYQDYVSAQSTFWNYSLRAQAVNESSELGNALNGCKLDVNLKSSESSVRTQANRAADLLDKNVQLKNQLIDLMGDEAFDKFIVELRQAESIDHLARMVVAFIPAGTAAIVFLIALPLDSVIGITVAGAVMLTAVGYMANRIYDMNKISAWSAILLSRTEGDRIQGKAHILSLHIATEFILNTLGEAPVLVKP